MINRGTTSGAPPVVSAEAITVGYGPVPVLREVSVAIPAGQFVAVVGPNASGKSTLVKALAGLLPCSGGTVYVDGTPLSDLTARAVARRLAVLPQSQIVPPAVRVGDFLTRGRYAHQGLLRQWSEADEDALQRAVELTGIGELLDRPLTDLSGGQRQRVWMAVVLTQDTPTLLLDEPTTYLDISHQLELLDLCASLHAQGRTIIAVLHDLSQAARYADRIICVNNGQIWADGAPEEVLTEQLLEDVFSIRGSIITDEHTGRLHIIARQRVSRSTVQP